MTGLITNLKVFVAAIFVGIYAIPVSAQDARLDPLFERLKVVSADDAPSIEKKIFQEMSKSGSASMDLLLRHARKEFEDDKLDSALKHLVALTDHAPEFAEGWHTKALVHFHREEIGLALDGLERTLALEPRHFRAMGGVMAILEELGAPEKALSVAKMIQSIHPHYEGLSVAIDRLEAKTRGESL